MGMSREEARQWLDRWKAVDEISIRELRETSEAEKFRQLASLMSSASLFQWPRNGEDERVQEMWARLRERTGR